MFIDTFFTIISKFHHNRISLYSKNLDFNNLIDIGTHKGEFLESFLKIKKIKRFYCFEPQKKIYDNLNKKFKRFNKIKLYNYALGDICSNRKIKINNLTSTSTLSKFNHNSKYLKFKNFLTGNDLRNQKSYIIKQKTIDRLFEKVSLKKTFMKIDVEGYEYKVLVGAKKKINQLTYVLVENQFFNQYKDYGNVKKFLLQNGFEVIKNFYFPTFHYKDVLYKKKGSKNCPF